MAVSKYPPDPLQRERLEELIATYRRRGQPERASYLERMHEGPPLLARLRSGDPSAVLELVAWWAGDSSQAIELLGARVRWADAKRELADALNDPRSHTPRLRHQISQRMHAQDRVRAELRTTVDAVLRAGLIARVDRYLRPAGIETADSVVYDLLRGLREEAHGSSLAAQQPLPKAKLAAAQPGHQYPVREAYIVVCDRCSFVDLRKRYARRCRRCQGARERLGGALWKPVTAPNSRWIVVGETNVTTGRCEVCEEAFAVERDSASNPHPACRTAKSRRSAREQWTSFEDDAKVLSALLAEPQLASTIARKIQIPKRYVLGALRRLERRGLARTQHPDGSPCVVVKRGRVAMDGGRVAESWIRGDATSTGLHLSEASLVDADASRGQ